ncbi:T9SS type A sorting domain-containing protein [Chryseobacterium oryctis]|uniref:T9SS type A sorting domain-containing protein n=1 Tax=Chryseobacterium oryctis TaxID=2952618 RepID=A0ABT3HPY6_9FLAO|nr:T9SS type A sorting domain-containing protein [Chryseobacterium oryctis]MCW3161850.1 T9SS type A sorting domain-containing protein [Chryseobacterium oryctis]
MKTKMYFSFCLLLFFFVSFAQVSVNASGGNTTNAGNSISYSIGQPFYHQTSGGEMTITEGVQQPFEITTLGTVDYLGIQLDAKVYPNPTSSLLFLKVEGISLKNLSYKMFDSSGRVLFQEKIKQTETSIDMTAKASGTYILSVLNAESTIKIFKILKN